MDLIQIDENGLHLVFEKTEDFGCKLLHFSALPFDERSLLHVHDRETGGLRLNTERYNLLEIMISGQNRPGERHGNKYISTSPGDRMKLVYFADKHNEFGRKLEIHMEDKICGIETISHMQFYNGIQAVRCWTDVKNVGTEPQGLEYVSSFALTGIEKEGMLSTDDKMRVWYPHNGWQREMQWESYTFPQLGLARCQPEEIQRSSKVIGATNIGNWSTKEYLPMGLLEKHGNGLQFILADRAQRLVALGDQRPDGQLLHSVERPDGNGIALVEEFAAGRNIHDSAGVRRLHARQI